MSAAVTVVFVTLLVLMVHLGPVFPCSEPVGWKPLPLQTRIQNADWIVVATDQLHYNRTTHPNGVSYWTQFALRCVLKGGGQPAATFHVQNMGVPSPFGGACTAHEVREGRNYFLFLWYDQPDGYYIIDEVNHEQGVYEYTSDNIQIFEEGLGRFRCDVTPVDTTTKTPKTTTTPGPVGAARSGTASHLTMLLGCFFSMRNLS
ncbi:Hypp4717 [Branchiostoma lanceolatum]|uniref:Hypp4717 protein n=1 Tax=Branchiostoma lanceolatum TaxID=7740 RepID=A0A8K0AAJ3_BRALA|nr:Hypp4717 [Branchiostoma lanceolatum]